VIVEYSIPKELGKSIDIFFSIFLPVPCHIEVVSHSPTPSTVTIAASLNGEVKNAKAACDR
jgi:hypothetical protein